MEILKNVEIYDLGLYLKKYKVFIIADIHMGYEEALNVRGVLVPRIQFIDTYARLKKILNKDIETIVVTGDFKHEFGSISTTEWRNITGLIDLFFEHCKRVIIIKGNHDVNLAPVAKKRNIEIVEYVKFENILICHGDEILDNEDFNNSEILIIGHEHPAIGLKEKNKYEFYKCFLSGKWKNKKLIVLPSFNLLTVGNNIAHGRILSPFLQHDLGDFEIFIPSENKTYNFGKIKDIGNK